MGGYSSHQELVKTSETIHETGGGDKISSTVGRSAISSCLVSLLSLLDCSEFAASGPDGLVISKPVRVLLLSLTRVRGPESRARIPRLRHLPSLIAAWSQPCARHPRPATTTASGARVYSGRHVEYDAESVVQKSNVGSNAAAVVAWSSQ